MNKSKIIYIIIFIVILCNIYKQPKLENFDPINIPNYDTLSELNQTYIKILSMVSDIFKELDIPFFLSSGSLLGYYREGKFLEHDYDIDIGIFQKDYTPKIIKKLKKKGFIYYRKFGNYKDGLELSFHLPNCSIGWKAKIDIFLHYTEDDNKSIYWISYYRKKRLKYKVSAFDLKKINFMGVDVWIPYPTERYLVEHYGSDWTIPRKHGIDYHYSMSPKSLHSD